MAQLELTLLDWAEQQKGAREYVPHHGADAFCHYGKVLFEVFKYLGVTDIAYNQPKRLPHATENLWG